MGSGDSRGLCRRRNSSLTDDQYLECEEIDEEDRCQAGYEPVGTTPGCKEGHVRREGRDLGHRPDSLGRHVRLGRKSF